MSVISKLFKITNLEEIHINKPTYDNMREKLDANPELRNLVDDSDVTINFYENGNFQRIV